MNKSDSSKVLLALTQENDRKVAFKVFSKSQFDAIARRKLSIPITLFQL